MTRRMLPVLALAFLAGAVVALGGFALLGHDGAVAAGPGAGYGGMMGGVTTGPGMMGGNGRGRMMGGNGPGGMMGGAYGPGMMGGLGGTVQTSVTPAELAAVRDRVEQRLADSGYKGFRVAEIMAFTRNDYVIVEDTAGKPAFELLADPKGRWLTPEPGPNMMWNTSYGTMQGVGVPGCPAATQPSGGTPLTAAQAKAKANAWLEQHRPGQTAADATALPGYFTIDVAEGGKTVGMLSVHATSGAVWFHTWHGTFLADRDF